jgi:hypothetical protein
MIICKEKVEEIEYSLLTVIEFLKTLDYISKEDKKSIGLHLKGAIEEFNSIQIID